MKLFGKMRGDMNKTVTRGAQRRMTVIIERDRENFAELYVTIDERGTSVQLFIEGEGLVYETEIESEEA